MELFAADGHDAGGCERVTGKSGMRPLETGVHDDENYDYGNECLLRLLGFTARELSDLGKAPAPRLVMRTHYRSTATNWTSAPIS